MRTVLMLFLEQVETQKGRRVNVHRAGKKKRSCEDANKRRKKTPNKSKKLLGLSSFLFRQANIRVHPTPHFSFPILLFVLITSFNFPVSNSEERRDRRQNDELKMQYALQTNKELLRSHLYIRVAPRSCYITETVFPSGNLISSRSISFYKANLQ
jgi:hypothetical protein